MVVLVVLRGKTSVGDSGGLLGGILRQTQPKSSICIPLPNFGSITDSVKGFFGCIGGVGRLGECGGFWRGSE